MSKLHLKENPTLRDFQNYVAEMIKECDLEKAFREKEKVNKKRTWERVVCGKLKTVVLKSKKGERAHEIA